eukprot:Skav209220  [mRNA]  locus=scaffold3787:11464:34149:+ [translate_table: standard]
MAVQWKICVKSTFIDIEDSAESSFDGLRWSQMIHRLEICPKPARSNSEPTLRTLTSLDEESREIFLASKEVQWKPRIESLAGDTDSTHDGEASAPETENAGNNDGADAAGGTTVGFSMGTRGHPEFCKRPCAPRRSLGEASCVVAGRVLGKMTFAGLIGLALSKTSTVPWWQTRHGKGGTWGPDGGPDGPWTFDAEEQHTRDVNSALEDLRQAGSFETCSWSDQPLEETGPCFPCETWSASCYKPREKWRTAYRVAYRLDDRLVSTTYFTVDTRRLPAACRCQEEYLAWCRGVVGQSVAERDAGVSSQGSKETWRIAHVKSFDILAKLPVHTLVYEDGEEAQLLLHLREVLVLGKPKDAEAACVDGILTIAYMMRLSGLVLGTLLLILLAGGAPWGAEVSMEVLMKAAVMKHRYTLGSLISIEVPLAAASEMGSIGWRIFLSIGQRLAPSMSSRHSVVPTGPYAEQLGSIPLVPQDLMLFLYGNGSLITYFIFLEVGAFLVVLIPSLPRDLSGLRFLSPMLGWIMAMGIIYTEAVVLVKCFASIPHLSPFSFNWRERHITLWNPDIFSTLQAFSLCVFSYVCHLRNVTPVAKELQNPEDYRIEKISYRALSCPTIVLQAHGAGYLTFGDETAPNLLTNYPADDPWILASRALAAAAMLKPFAMDQSIVALVMNDGFRSWAHLHRAGGGGDQHEPNSASDVTAMCGADVVAALIQHNNGD